MKCDASHLGLGASIEQDHRGNWKTVAFASRFLNVAELKYSTNELELLGLVWALDHFKNYLLGKQFSILTDHKALKEALRDDKYTKTAQSRLTRWVDKLLPFELYRRTLNRVKTWDLLITYPDIHRANPYRSHSTTKSLLSPR